MSPCKIKHFPHHTLQVKNAQQGGISAFNRWNTYSVRRLADSLCEISTPASEKPLKPLAFSLQKILTSKEGNRALILYSWGTMLSKSMNLKVIALTACTAWLPQLRSSASKEPGPYKYNVSLSSSARWQILRGEGTVFLVLKYIHRGKYHAHCKLRFNKLRWEEQISG